LVILHGVSASLTVIRIIHPGTALTGMVVSMTVTGTHLTVTHTGVVTDMVTTTPITGITMVTIITIITEPGLFIMVIAEVTPPAGGQPQEIPSMPET
jgi:hypothetical protein